MPQRHQLSRARGYRKPAGAIVVSRPSRWGNPCPLDRALSRHPAGGGPLAAPYDPAQAAEQFAELLRARYRADPAALAAWLAPLRGRDLCCWCPPSAACHADYLLHFANAPEVVWHRYDALLRAGRAWTPAEAAEVTELRAWLAQRHSGPGAPSPMLQPAAPAPCRCPACLPALPPDPATATGAEVFAHGEHLRKLAALGSLPGPSPYASQPPGPLTGSTASTW